MTSTLRDPQSDIPPLQKPAVRAVDDPSVPKRRPSCTACSATPSRYPAGSQQASPVASRRNSQQRINNHAIVPSTTSSRSSSQDSLSGPSPNPNFNPNPRSHAFADLASPSSSSFQGPGFSLNFNTHHSHPKIKCHIDHLHQDLDLDVKLNDGNDANNINNNDKSLVNHATGTTRFTLDCYNRSHPDKNIKLRLELVQTSPKGFGLRIMEYMPNDSNSDDPSETKKGNSMREKTQISHSRRSSIQSESSKSVPKIRDIADLDEVRISSVSKAGDHDSEDTCKCTTPCGVPGCKAEEAHKHTEETL